MGETAGDVVARRSKGIRGCQNPSLARVRMLCTLTGRSTGAAYGGTGPSTGTMERFSGATGDSDADETGESIMGDMLARDAECA